MPLTGKRTKVKAPSTIRGSRMSAKAEVKGVWNVLRMLGWVAVAGLLLLPLVAMQFTAEVNWTIGDFIFAGVILGGAGLATEFLMRRSGSNAYRIGAVLTILVMFLTVWSNLAVGIIGDEGNAFNLLFFGVILLAIVGMILARFRSAGMAFATLAAAVVQAAVSAIGMGADVRGGIISLGFAGLWLIAAALFWAARVEARA